MTIIVKEPLVTSHDIFICSDKHDIKICADLISTDGSVYILGQRVLIENGCLEGTKCHVVGRVKSYLKIDGNMKARGGVARLGAQPIEIRNLYASALLSGVHICEDVRSKIEIVEEELVID